MTFWAEERKRFYKHAMVIAIPIMIQNGVTSFVNMLDNVMVGSVGTDPMSGVAVVNQLMLIVNLCLLGGLSGVGIFTAQFYGKGDHKGIRYTFRLQLYAALLVTAVGMLVFKGFGTQLISLYLHEDGGVGSVQATMGFARDYLDVILLGVIPFALTQVYATTLKSCGETVIPMRASVVAVLVNLAGNYILIFGKFGAPALGVVGAAIATNISRVVELAFIVIYTHTHAERFPFIRGAYRSLAVPGSLAVNCIKKGLPLLFNEALWSGGQAALVQNYSLRGLSVVAAFNISQTITNIFNVTFIAMGVAIGIIVGQELGSGSMSTVRRTASRLTLFSVVVCMFTGLVMLLISGLFPRIYNTSPEIRGLAANLIRISALFMPMYAYENACYFTVRSGGKTLITFLFDSFFAWAVQIPLAYLLATRTQLPILPLFACIQAVELIKCGIGFILVHKGIWINDITQYREA